MPRAWVVAVIVLAILAKARCVWAALSDYRPVESIELSVGDSDVVVVGRIVCVTSHRLAERDPSAKLETVTLQVHETLKGEAAAAVTFLALDWDRSTWHDKDTDVLVCLVNGARYVKYHSDFAEGCLALRRAPQPACGPANLAGYPLDGSVPAMSKSGFQLLHGGDQILNVARRIAVEPAPMAREQIPVPSDADIAGMPCFREDGAGNWLWVPVDAELEAYACVLSQSASAFDRRQGARCLAHFQSHANETILKSMLADHDSITDYVEPFPVRRYYVRDAARQTLEAWGVAFTRPVTEERLYWQGTKRLIRDHWPDLILLAACVVVLVAVIRCCWRWRTRPPGFCIHCGYDLRATPARCPECGAVPAGVSAPVRLPEAACESV